MCIYIIIFLVSVGIANPLTIDISSKKQERNFTPRDEINIQERNFTRVEENTKTEISIDDKMKALRIEMVKYQILSKLNMKEAPPSVQRPSEASKEIVRLLMKEEEEWQQKRNRLLDSEERLVIHAKKYNMRCLHHNVSYCKMFHFEISPFLNTPSVDLWIYKSSESPKWISVSLSSSTSWNNYESLYYEVHDSGWSKLQLPDMFIPPSWNETTYTIEIVGQNIEYEGEQRPFLLISKLVFINSRQRREISCNSNDSCCWRPFSVSFAEIGFDWVLYPSDLEANLCSGKCTNDPSMVSTHYEIAMQKLLEKDDTLKNSLGECWTLCCKPKVLEAVRVFYNDTNGIIHDQYIPELSVKTCGCS